MKRLSILFLFMITWIHSTASHIVGGGFELKQISLNTYTLNLYLYVDVIHAMPGVIAGETSLEVGVFEKGTNLQVTRLTLTRAIMKNIPTADTCRLAHLNTDQLIFQKEIELNPATYNHPQGYYISFQRCCRQAVIQNIIDPVYEGIAFVYEFPSLAFGANSSSSYPALKDIQALLGHNYTMDFSSTDPDGDSLSYKLVAPKAGLADGSAVVFVSSGPYPEINWKAGYDLSTIIPGSPALKIDEVTGMLHVTPTLEGEYLFAAETEEYRNGVKIASATREFRILVIEQSAMVCLGPEPQDPIVDPFPLKLSILSPNPSTDFLTIDLRKIPGIVTKLEIVDILGEQVTLIPANTYIDHYDIRFLDPGVYFLIIHSSVVTKRERFIKK